MAENTQTATLTPEARIAQLEAELAANKQIIEEQAEQLQAAEASAETKRPVVTHNRKQYSVLANQFTFDGKLVKAEELAGKPEVVKALIEAESGLLVLVQKAEKPAAE
ncbi:hypothetical protein HER32_06705 [Hymenobacter sp. BT18]|uniref:hypothetical protein n=1 Tax=Hymenobacter sp. BT18 TaxID=2835648 RepID=UPI00143E234C|nr:hypothetical protein [Hymenobacter sp. BT18]QIX60883.1 hypothetical protein HER32_06705 [Hymenobacter sp. BT18]